MPASGLGSLLGDNGLGGLWNSAQALGVAYSPEEIAASMAQASQASRVNPK